jgi:glucoamylase
MEALEEWIERQYRHSAAAMLRSVSAVHTVKIRPGFGQSMTARKGSIVASPVLGAYDPEPDYFFHWYRDSAVVIDALRLLYEDPSIDVDALGHLSDFVHFSLSLQELDGRSLISSPHWRLKVAPDFEQFVRSDDDLSRAHGESVAGETRINPDGTLDISKWPRPQNDGPAMRALTLLRWRRSARLGADLERVLNKLVQADLQFTRRRWREPCFDIWEEEAGHHYYTLRIAAAALEEGAEWFAGQGNSADAAACRADAAEMLQTLDGYWLEERQFYRSRQLDSATRSAKELDISVILGVLHAAGSGDRHSVYDPRMHATLARLEELFGAEYAINRHRGSDRAPAMGRYAGDVYFSGGAYYFSTLAAAEFCFRAAARSPARNDWHAHGDAFLQTVRAYTPPSGEMSEQFDQHTGIQRSAQQLAWSYAAFISCVEARRQIAALGKARA